MARRKRRMPPRSKRTGRFMSRASASAPRRKRRVTRRVRVHTGRFGRRVRRVRVAKHPVLVNRRRRRTRRYAYVSNPRRRRLNARGFMKIFSRPMLRTVGYSVVGFVGTPMLTGFLNRWLPSQITVNRWGQYLIKAGSAYGLSLVADRVAGREAGRSVLIGGLAYVTLGVVQDFFPQLLGGTAAPTGRYLQKQPLLAEYVTPSMRGPITAGAPTRLDPANRF